MLMQPISSFISFLEPPTVIFDKVPKDTDFFFHKGEEKGKEAAGVGKSGEEEEEEERNARSDGDV